MYAGALVEEGPVGEVLGGPKHPYTAGLLNSVPQLGGGRRRLGAIPGRVPDLAQPPSGCAFHPRCPRAGKVCEVECPAMSSGRAQRFACHYPLPEQGERQEAI
ncbi:MAG: hypothetical protein R3316_11135 [Rhodovibrionaceae bacterium]|nr:hypothetical protein [Rhodovibrionaceae bacterium]